jgi:hypothetical protein
VFAFASRRLGAHTRLANTTSLACRVKGCWVLDEKKAQRPRRELGLSMIQFGNRIQIDTLNKVLNAEYAHLGKPTPDK